jgi:hypothetical protein
LNIHRRHYTPQQRAVYAARYLVPELKVEALERMRRRVPATLFPNLEKGNANAIAARQAGTNEKYVQYAVHIDKANARFLDFVMARQMNLQDGMKFIQMKAEKRTYLFDQMKEGKTYKEALRLYQDIARSPSETETSKKFPLAKAKDSSRVSIVRKLESGTSDSNLSNRSLILPAFIQEHVLKDMVDVLHRHGYCETPYRVWLAEDTFAVQKPLVPLFVEGGVTAYEVSPSTSIQISETVSEETSGEDNGVHA